MQYLGHPVTNNRQNSLVEETTKDFTCKVNGVSSYFDKINYDVKSVFFKLYCTSFYGAQVCTLCDGVIEIFNIAHRTALRTIWGLPYRIRRKLLPHIVCFYVCPDHE